MDAPSSPTTRAKPSNDDILDIATQAFAQKGFEGARMDEIAHAAAVNKATLYYRIGDKAALFGAVLKRLFSDKVVRLEQILETVEDVEQRVRTFAGILVDGDHPERFSALMLREIAAGGRNLPDDVLPLMGRIVHVLEQTLSQGVAQGRFKPINPFLAHMALVGACTLYATNGPIRRRLAALASDGSALDIELPLEEAATTIADMLLGGIRIP